MKIIKNNMLYNILKCNEINNNNNNNIYIYKYIYIKSRFILKL